MAESLERKKERVRQIIELLKSEFPDSKISLDFTSPLELLVATILSAQCTDERVNQVTPGLFRKYRTPEDYVSVPHEELAADIRQTGFFNNKAKSIRKCCRRIIDAYDSAVPTSMEELTTLPGVGRKTANVLLGSAFGTPGIVVDTHVKRVSGRLGLSDKKDPDKIETDLNVIVPQPEWTHFSHLLIDLGRKQCGARQPLCAECPVNHLCPSCDSGNR